MTRIILKELGLCMDISSLGLSREGT
jgi:hypothetical protein